jgi:hypothetical protein
MLSKSITRSGLALANAGLSTAARAGIAYFLDPNSGKQRRHALRERAGMLLANAEKLGDKLSRGFHEEAAELGQLLDRMAPGRRGSPTRPLLAAGIGLSMGAGLMYLLDPQEGPGRRARLRDRFMQTQKGIVSAVREQLHLNQVSDAELVERVQTVVQYVIAHPEAVAVSAHEGVVTVAGSVEKDEVEKLLTCIAAVRGVRGVTDHLSAAAPSNGAGAPFFPANAAH